MAFRGWDKENITLPDNRSAEAICPVIVSASRATDIPAFYAKWFRNRLEAGYLLWTNPFNANQNQYVSFKKTRVLVFWSKNPRPLMKHLTELDKRKINYYFQFTLNDYEPEGLEPNVPSLEQRIDTFRTLSNLVGKRRVIWRFDPLMLTDDLTIDGLLDRISRVEELLRGYTEKLVISFADIGVYRKVQSNLAREHVRYREWSRSAMMDFAQGLQQRNTEWGLRIATCAEGIDLQEFGMSRNKCIDDDLMTELFQGDSALMDFLGCGSARPGYERDLWGNSASAPSLKDKGQRKECGCIVSKDIGTYDTCNHLCLYCYANSSRATVKRNIGRHAPEAEAMLGQNATTSEP